MAVRQPRSASDSPAARGAYSQHWPHKDPDKTGQSCRLSRNLTALALPTRRGGCGKARAPRSTLKAPPSSPSSWSSQRKSHIAGQGALKQPVAQYSFMLCSRLIRLAAYVSVLVITVQCGREMAHVDGLAAPLAASSLPPPPASASRGHAVCLVSCACRSPSPL